MKLLRHFRSTDPTRAHRARRAAVVMAAGALSLAACAAPTRYMGISLRPGAADAGLQSLAQRALEGDKHAQLELGIRFEEGRGVPCDPARAMKLYRAAASDSGGTMWVYSPPVQKGAAGQVLQIWTGLPQMGLENARERLEAIEHRRKR